MMISHPRVAEAAWGKKTWWSRGLTVLAVLTLARVWLAPASDVVHAQQAGGKQVPFDATAQRSEIVEELRKTNQILLGILDTLRNTTLRVEVQQGSEDPAGKDVKKKP